MMQGVIFPGRYADFLKLPNTPHDTFIRGYSGVPYSKMLSSPNSDFRVLGCEMQADGLTLVKVGGTVSKGIVEITLWLCPERSFLPIKFVAVRTRDNRKMIEYSTSDFAPLTDGSYYPQKVVLGSDGASPWGHIEIRNTSTEPLPAEFFRPNMPPNTHVTDHVLKVSYTTNDAADVGIEEEIWPDGDPYKASARQAATAERKLDAYVSDFNIRARTTGNRRRDTQSGQGWKVDRIRW